MSASVTLAACYKPDGNFTLAALLDRIVADDGLSRQKRQDVASALRGLAKVLRLPAASISAAPSHLRLEINKLTPAMAGLSPGRWRNIRTLTQFALAHVGLAKVPGRYRSAPSAAWSVLVNRLVYGDRYRLGHLARYCTVSGIEPGDIDDAVLGGFLMDLQRFSLAAEPERMHREAIIVWNRAASTHPEWPQRTLLVPNNRPSYVLPWESFPSSLKEDVDSWLDRLAGTDPFDDYDFKPLRAASLVTRKKQIHEYLSALVIEGVEQSDLRVLADAVTPDRAKKGLNFFWKRAGNKPSLHGCQIAGVVKALARHRAKLLPADLDRLKTISRRITPDSFGMTERNKTRLRPLDDRQQVRDLLTLPTCIRAEVVGAGTPTHSLAVRLQAAVMVELLLMVPIRLRNLSSLTIGKHLLFGRGGEVTLAIPGHEVKNGMSIEAHLPGETADLLDLYIAKYRPLIDPGSTWLFPGRTADAPKSDDGLRQQLKTCLRERCGLDFTPHTFRHATGKILLDQNPGAHGQVQQILGHKRIATTIAFYTGLEGKNAIAHWDKLVTEMRNTDATMPSRALRRKV